jgi:hypothetical protein
MHHTKMLAHLMLHMMQIANGTKYGIDCIPLKQVVVASLRPCVQVASDVLALHLGKMCHDPSAGSGGCNPRALAGANAAGAADGAVGAAAPRGRQGAKCGPRSSGVCGRQGPWGKCVLGGKPLLMSCHLSLQCVMSAFALLLHPL